MQRTQVQLHLRIRRLAVISSGARSVLALGLVGYQRRSDHFGRSDVHVQAAEVQIPSLRMHHLGSSIGAYEGTVPDYLR
jgi:hypothetical protein